MLIYQVELMYMDGTDITKIFFNREAAYAYAKKEDILRKTGSIRCIKEIGILKSTSLDPFDNSARFEYIEMDYNHEETEI